MYVLVRLVRERIRPTLKPKSEDSPLSIIELLAGEKFFQRAGAAQILENAQITFAMFHLFCCENAISVNTAHSRILWLVIQVRTRRNAKEERRNIKKGDIMKIV